MRISDWSSDVCSSDLAMDLVAGVKRVVAVMSHMDKAGNPKIVKSCSLPLTGADVVDAIVSELGSFALDRDRSLLIVNQLADGVDMDLVRRVTGDRHSVV